MKQNILLLLLIISFPMAAISQEKITLDVENRPVTEALRQIEKQSGYTFSYSPSLLKNFPPVTVRITDEPLEKALQVLFGKTDIQAVIQGKYIILKKRPKEVTVSGFVYDRESHESLIAANIYDQVSGQGAVSNNFGFYSLSVPPGEIELRPSYVGYASKNHPFRATQDTVIHFFLQPSSSLSEVVIEGKKQGIVGSSETGKISMTSEEIKSIPSLLGEQDLIKALQQMPGVSVGTEGMAGMYVRGGNIDENLYLVDGNPMYHVNHMFGFFSTFNPEAVKVMNFYKGSFPARFGGRLSSVVDVRTNDGDMNKYRGTVSIGLLSSRLNIQGPIIRNKTSFNFSLRRTYMDAITGPLIHYSNKRNIKDNPEDFWRDKLLYYFYDMNAKINHQFSDRSRLYLSIYSGIDKAKLGVEGEREESNSTDPFQPDFMKSYTFNQFSTTWGTRMASLNWAYAVNNKLFSNITFSYSKYNSDITTRDDSKSLLKYHLQQGDSVITRNSFHQSVYRSSIEDIGMRIDMDYTPLPGHLVRFGGSFLHHNFYPEENITFLSEENNEETKKEEVVFANDLIKVQEISLYAEDEVDINDKLRVNAGIHLSDFLVQGKNYLSLQPRISGRYMLSENVSVKASYAKMNQYVHLLQNSIASLPNDLWVPITKNIKPMVSHQVSAGIYGAYKGYDLSMEGYYKKSKNQVEYIEGASYLELNTNWQEKVAQGNATAYGLEWLVRKNFGKTTGWLGYTLSWANRQFPGGEINYGNPYPAKTDNRHKINLAVKHTLNKKFDLNGSWVYSSGNWITLPTEQYISVQGMQNYYRSRNNYKMPGYHRLDLGINYYRHKKNGRMGIWNVSVYNVYNKMNAFLVYPIQDFMYDPVSNGYKSNKRYKKLSILPIIPSFSYTYTF